MAKEMTVTTDLWDQEKIGVAIIGACAFMVMLNRIHKYLPVVKCWKKDADADEIEYRPIRSIPQSLQSLTTNTNFTTAEVKTLYRVFKNECPSGVVYEDTFKSIYSHFFPMGDSDMYAHYVFNALDEAEEGFICFEALITALSSLLRGSVDEKLQWTFRLYDINRDGFITKDEVHDIVKSIYSLLGNSSHSQCVISQHANQTFQKLDLNKDGYVTYSEFVRAFRTDAPLVASLKIFDSAI